jgi:hypothetical protein
MGPIEHESWGVIDCDTKRVIRPILAKAEGESFGSVPRLEHIANPSLGQVPEWILDLELCMSLRLVRWYF